MPVASIPACLAADQQGVAFRGPVRYPTPAHYEIGIPLAACDADFGEQDDLGAFVLQLLLAAYSSRPSGQEIGRAHV